MTTLYHGLAACALVLAILIPLSGPASTTDGSNSILGGVFYEVATVIKG